MILGEFNSKGELIFEIGLISADGDTILFEATLDTGFTGWLAIDSQDADSLGWRLEKDPTTMLTAGGETAFNLYVGTVLLDAEEYKIPVLGGNEIETILLGVQWLQTKRLIVDFSAKVLTLG